MGPANRSTSPSAHLAGPLAVAAVAFLLGVAAATLSHLPARSRRIILCHAAAAAGDTQALAPPPSDLRIPRILHHIYLSGEAAFVKDTSPPEAPLLPDWRRSCLAVHPAPAWEHRFWDEAAVSALIHERYPWLEYAYTNETRDCTANGPNCDPLVLRADLARLVVLHAHGGLYLDLDIECWVPADPALRGADLVLQATATFEGVTNAVMAGVAGHGVWEAALRMAAARVGNASMLVFDRTGPNLVSEGRRLVMLVLEIFNGSLLCLFCFPRRWRRRRQRRGRRAPSPATRATTCGRGSTS